MKCPSPIAEILLNILQTGILRIRAAAWAGNTGQVETEADHVHNLPAILEDYSADALKFYWEIERPCFLSKAPDVADGPSGPRSVRSRRDQIDADFLGSQVAGQLHGVNLQGRLGCGHAAAVMWHHAIAAQVGQSQNGRSIRPILHQRLRCSQQRG